MNIGEITYAIQSFFMGRNTNRELSLDQLKSYYQLASEELFRHKFGTGKKIGGFEQFRENADAMKRYVSDYVTIALTSGIGTLNANQRHFADIYVNDSGAVPIDVVTNAEFRERSKNPVTLPTTTYPIATVYNDTTIEVLPSSITSIKIKYVQLPTTPVLTLKLENGIMVYDSGNSTDFDWETEYEIDLIRIVLKYLGVPETDLVSFSLTEQERTN